MVTRAKKKTPTRQASRAAKIRRHYHQARVERVNADGKPYWYNPLLDDPNHPDNPRHWIHGTAAGYGQAGCGCPPCRQAGSVENKRKEEARLDRRLADHRERIAVILGTRLPDLPPETITHGTEHVTAVHRVTRRDRAIVVYDEQPLRLALDVWARAESVTLDDMDRDVIAAAIVADLAP